MDSDEVKKKRAHQLEVYKNSQSNQLVESQVLQQKMQENMDPIKRSIASIVKIQESTNKVLEPLKPILQMQENMRLVLEPVRKSIVDLNSVMKPVEELLNVFKKTFSVQYDFSGLSKFVRRMDKLVLENVQKINIPSISEEHKRKLIEAHKLWGGYGWTINPCASEEIIVNYMPVDKKAADNIAIKQCSTQTMEQVFEITCRNKRVKKSDFEEAVFDYRHKQYKSCALMLFSLVDATLIRLQKKSNLNGQRRKVGLCAVSEAKKRTATDINTGLFFTAMFCTNLFACLEKVFEGGKDFKKQPGVINRNFLAHGMMTTDVRKRDCIQLFLLYYNMLELLDMIY